MDLSRLTKRLDLPPGFEAPRLLEFEGIEAQALGREHLADDIAGINASLELIARTRGGGWPEGPVDEEFDYVDLVWHEQEFREGESFSYAVYETGGPYIGCCYLYPVGLRTPLSDELLENDVDVSWWVAPEAYERGHYERLYRALGDWITTAFPFSSPYYSNTEIPEG